MIDQLQHIEAQLEALIQSNRNTEVAQAEMARVLAARHEQIETMLHILGERHSHLESLIAERMPVKAPQTPPPKMEAFSTHLFRNMLPNDDAALQKGLVANWRLHRHQLLEHAELTESGFRVFSQNDEDGVLLRLFAHIGHTNRYVIEIGSNCNGSDIDIPENLSANLIVNHAWHGAIFELDAVECDKMRYFFARDHATRHFHWERDGQNRYFSPLIIQGAVTPENINALLLSANTEPVPDLMIIDIDGGDYAVMQSLTVIRPRVIVVEFEKRFRQEHSVFQRDRNDFSQRWQQSGTVSLTAWQKLLEARGYILVTVSSCGYNAFFVNADVAAGKILPASPQQLVASHPIFSRMPEEFWLTPDETWSTV